MRFTPQLPSQFTQKNSKNSAKAAFLKSVKDGGKKPSEQTAQERHQEIFNQKLEEMRSEAMKGAKYTFQLPGTDASQCHQLSKGAQEIIQKIAEKKAEKDKKKMKKTDKVAVRPKYFGGQHGGRIDSKGNIYDGAGQCILQVDKKTGKIKHAASGNVVGNYNPDSTYSEHRISELIAKYASTNQRGWYAGTPGLSGGAASDGGSVWGKESESCGNASIWGSAPSGGGSIWGSNKEDNNSSWW